MQNYSADVAEILDRAYQSPVVLRDQEETGKAQFTRRAAWDLHQKDPNIGLVTKTSGNQVGGLSVDLLMDKSDGSWTDVASKSDVDAAHVEIRSVWVPHGGEEPNSPSVTLWVQPTQALADQPGPLEVVASNPAPGPEPNPTPPPANGPIIVVFKVVSPEGVPMEALLRAFNKPFGDWAALTCACCGAKETVLGPSVYKIRVEAEGFNPDVNTADYDLRWCQVLTITLR